jgi:Cysteine-rich secretory protein family
MRPNKTITFHVKHSLFLVFILCSSLLQAQEVFYTKSKIIKYPEKDTSIYNPIKRNAITKTLTTEQLDVLYTCNVLRLKPQYFLDSFVTPFMKAHDELLGPNWKSLQKDLKKANPLKAFTPHSLLFKTATAHAKDLSSTGKLSHNSSNGDDFFTRITKSGLQGCAGENINYATNNTAAEAVILLMLDNGVPNLGHRKALLNPDYLSIGVALATFKSGKVLVQDFGCNLP